MTSLQSSAFGWICSTSRCLDGCSRQTRPQPSWRLLERVGSYVLPVERRCEASCARFWDMCGVQHGMVLACTAELLQVWVGVWRSRAVKQSAAGSHNSGCPTFRTAKPKPWPVGLQTETQPKAASQPTPPKLDTFRCCSRWGLARISWHRWRRNSLLLHVKNPGQQGGLPRFRERSRCASNKWTNCGDTVTRRVPVLVPGFMFLTGTLWVSVQRNVSGSQVKSSADKRARDISGKLPTPKRWKSLILPGSGGTEG